jgi:hypothetical protein
VWLLDGPIITGPIISKTDWNFRFFISTPSRIYAYLL